MGRMTATIPMHSVIRPFSKYIIHPTKVYIPMRI